MLSNKGVQPDPKITAAIQDIEPPKSESELENLLSMVNYLAKFRPNLGGSHHTYDESSKKDSELVWDCAKDSAFKDTKMLTAFAGTLACFDTNKSVAMEVDAYKHDLGAVLLQDSKPVGYASKSLTPTEQEYEQIEKETYAIVFRAERFHAPIYLWSACRSHH